MRRRVSPSILLAVVAVVACSEEPVSYPTAPPRFNLETAPPIEDQIRALYPDGGLEDAMLSRWATLQKQVATGDRGAARQHMLINMVDFTLMRETRGQLMDPEGSAPPSTDVAISLLVASLYRFVYPDAPPPPVVEEGVDIGIGVIVPNQDETVVTEEQWAGADVDAGTFTQPVLMTITELPDPPSGGTGPLPTDLRQYPKFYDFSVFPNEPTLKAIRIGICHVTDPASPYFPPEDHSQLRIAKETHDAPPQTLILDRADVADFLLCADVSAESPIVIGAARSGGLGAVASRALTRAVAGLAALVTPKSLYAIDQGIGGFLHPTFDDEDPTGSEPAFSTFGIVELADQRVVCSAPATVGTTYSSVAAAVAAASDGDVIEFCSGTYVVDDVRIRKSLSFRPLPGHTVTIGKSYASPASFRIDSMASGSAKFLGLKFEPSGIGFAIYAGPVYDQVWIENSSFVMEDTALAAVWMAGTDVETAHATITSSSFAGANQGVFASETQRVDVTGSTFTNHRFSSLQVQSSAIVNVWANQISECGRSACIRLRFNGTVEVKTNTLSAALPDTVIFGILVDGGTAIVEDNTLIGGEPVGSLYAWGAAGIQVGFSAGTYTTATVSRNQVAGAYRGIGVQNGAATGTDNIVDLVQYGLVDWSNGTVNITRSDITNYVFPMSGSLLQVTCNWWGSAAGPSNVIATIPASAYTPWAIAPIANNAGGACTGGDVTRSSAPEP